MATQKQVDALADLFWDYLKKSPGHPDRRMIAGGDKTKLGLALTVERIMQENA